MAVTGALSLSLREDVASSRSRCAIDAVSGSASNTLDFGDGTGTYVLQLSLPAWTTTFPDVTKKAGVSFLDVTLTDISPPGSPALPPVHLSGTWSC